MPTDSPDIFNQLLHKAVSARETMPASVADPSIVNFSLLDESVNNLAGALQANGVIASTRVGMYLNRGLDQIIAVLALWRLGAVYVPFDVTQESSYHEAIIRNCDIKTWIKATDTAEPLVSRVTKVWGTNESSQFIDIDEKAIGASSPLTYNGAADINDLIAFIINSSGTTGKPKGVPIRHHGLRYWAGVLEKFYSTREVSGVVATVSVAFDAHLWDYLIALVTGVPLYIADEETRRNPIKLLAFMQAHPASELTLTPSMLTTLIEANLLRSFRAAGLKRVNLVGESCTLQNIQACLAAGLDPVNCYGPTETTFGASMLSFRELLGSVGASAPLESIFYKEMAPIAFPEAPVEAMVLVPEGEVYRIAAEGESGELVIVGGNNVTPGYIGASAEASAKIKESIRLVDGRVISGVYFTSDKFVQNAGRLYCEGRLGANAKRNGILVNTEAVELTLGAHESIAQACVVIRPNRRFPDRNGTMVACIQLKDGVGMAPSTRELRSYLRGAGVLLPAIPSAFEFGPLPLAVSGKVDRVALTTKETLFLRDLSYAQTPPRNALEETILAIWGVIAPPGFIVGINDPFTYIGGDSIGIVSVVSEINTAYGINLTLNDLVGSLEELTVEKLSVIVYQKVLERRRTGDAKTPDLKSLVKTESVRSELPLFLVHDITGSSNEYYDRLVGKLASNREVYSISHPGLSNPDWLCCDLRAVAADYVAQIRHLQPDGPYYLAGWSTGAAIAALMAELLENQKQKVKYLGLIDEILPNIINESKEKFAKELVGLLKILKWSWLVEGFTLSEREDFGQDPVQLRLSEFLKNDSPIDQVKRLSLKSTSELAIFRRWRVIQSLLYGLATIRFQALKTTSPVVYSTEASQSKMGVSVKPETRAALGWNTLTVCVTGAATVDGDHFSIMGEKLPELAMRMQAELDRRKHVVVSDNRSVESAIAPVIRDALAEQKVDLMEAMRKLMIKLFGFRDSSGRLSPDAASSRVSSGAGSQFGGVVRGNTVGEVELIRIFDVAAASVRGLPSGKSAKSVAGSEDAVHSSSSQPRSAFTELEPDSIVSSAHIPASLVAPLPLPSIAAAAAATPASSLLSARSCRLSLTSSTSSLLPGVAASSPFIAPAALSRRIASLVNSRRSNSVNGIVSRGVDFTSSRRRSASDLKLPTGSLTTSVGRDRTLIIGSVGVSQEGPPSMSLQGRDSGFAVSAITSLNSAGGSETSIASQAFTRTPSPPNGVDGLALADAVEVGLLLEGSHVMVADQSSMKPPLLRRGTVVSALHATPIFGPRTYGEDLLATEAARSSRGSAGSAITAASSAGLSSAFTLTTGSIGASFSRTYSNGTSASGGSSGSLTTAAASSCDQRSLGSSRSPERSPDRSPDFSLARDRFASSGHCISGIVESCAIGLYCSRGRGGLGEAKVVAEVVENSAAEEAIPGPSI